MAVEKRRRRRPHLEINDEGRGSEQVESHSWLRGLEERVSFVGDLLRAGRNSGSGFRVQVEIPLRMIPVLLAEDQTLLRHALAEILDRGDDITVVAQVGRGDEVLAAALRTPARGRPDRRRDARP